MENWLALLAGILFAGCIYLMLAGDLIRYIFGLVLASNAVNLMIFTAGRVGNFRPPLVPEGMLEPAGPVANALPQALILTAIVIGFALLAFVFILVYRIFQDFGTVETASVQNTDSPPTAAGPPVGERP
jgi:multicomponent Na+:H+ antiporter subunit C